MRRHINKKVVLLGAAGVGKTALVTQFTTGKWNPFSESTIGASFSNQVVPLPEEDVVVKLQVWDTAGQERFESLAPMYYRGADVALVVFDITQRSSFEKAQKWISDLDKDTVIALVGNKTDMESNRTVTTEEAKKLAELNSCIFYETSAKTAFNVGSLFETLSKRLAEIDNEKSYQPTPVKTSVTLGRDGKSESSGGCCK